MAAKKKPMAKKTFPVPVKKSKRPVKKGDPSVDERANELMKECRKMFSRGNAKNLDIKTWRDAAELFGEISGRSIKYLSIRSQQGYKGR